MNRFNFNNLFRALMKLDKPDSEPESESEPEPDESESEPEPEPASEPDESIEPNSEPDYDSDLNSNVRSNSDSNSENVYECSACGTLVKVDPYLIYDNEQLNLMDYKSKPFVNHWHNKYAFAKEVEPGYWLTFCRRVCEIKYERQHENDWEFSKSKK